MSTVRVDAYAPLVRPAVVSEAGQRHLAKDIKRRLAEGEALLFHGMNPSSSVNILTGGFALGNAGSSTGTMLGHGVYLARSLVPSEGARASAPYRGACKCKRPP